MNSSKSQTQWGQFIPLVIVFFFWGFVAASNDILIPVFKKAFDLTQGQSQFVSIAFYISYTVGSLIYMGVSLVLKQDLVNKIGYKNGLALGLVISALGTLLFYGVIYRWLGFFIATNRGQSFGYGIRPYKNRFTTIDPCRRNQ